MKTMTSQDVGARGSLDEAGASAKPAPARRPPDTRPMPAVVHALEQRLARVERSNRRLLRVCGAGALVSLALLVMGQAPVVAVPDVIAAKSFRLVDASGRVRGVWEAGQGEDFALVVYDAAGKKASTLRLSVADPYIALSDAGGATHEGKHLFSWGGIKRDEDQGGARAQTGADAEKSPKGEQAEKGGGDKDWPTWGGDPDEAEPFSWDD